MRREFCQIQAKPKISKLLKISSLGVQVENLPAILTGLVFFDSVAKNAKRHA
jgi:hypothetical protein